MIRIYISGKRLNEYLDELNKDPEKYAEKFAIAENGLMEAGIPHEYIINPIKFGFSDNDIWTDMFKIYIDAINKCDAIYMLRDWKSSLIARNELTIAGKNRKTIYFEENNDIGMIRDCITSKII